jgi:hypothetical protein
MAATPKHRRPYSIHREIVRLIVMLTLVGALVWIDSGVAQAGTTSDRITWQTVGTRAVPCPYEDTIPKRGACYWDGKQRGNKRGASFVVWSSGRKMWLR